MGPLLHFYNGAGFRTDRVGGLRSVRRAPSPAGPEKFKSTGRTTCPIFSWKASFDDCPCPIYVLCNRRPPGKLPQQFADVVGGKKLRHRHRMSKHAEIPAGLLWVITPRPENLDELRGRGFQRGKLRG